MAVVGALGAEGVLTDVAGWAERPVWTATATAAGLALALALTQLWDVVVGGHVQRSLLRAQRSEPARAALASEGAPGATAPPGQAGGSATGGRAGELTVDLDDGRGATGAPSGAGQVGLGALLPYLRPHLRVFVAVSVLSVATATGMLAQPMLIRSVLDGLHLGTPVGGLLLTLVLLLLFAGAASAVRDYLLHRTGEGVVLSVRQQLAARMLRLPMYEYDRRRTGDLLARLSSDTTLLRSVVTGGLMELLSGVVVLFGAVGMMLMLDPLLFAVTVLGLTGAVGAVAVAQRIQGASTAAQEKLGEMTSATERAVSGIRTVRAARAEERETREISRSATGAYRAGLRIARLRAFVGPLMTSAVQVASLIVLGVGGSRVAAGAMSIGDLVAFVALLFLMMMPILQAVGAYADLQTGLGALRRIEEVLSLREETADDRPTTPAPGGTVRHPAAGPPAAVEFDGVTFGYSAADPVLREVSFRVPHGSRCALVGPSGGGKSTTLALMERFYDVDRGAVRVDGVDVRDLPRAELRGRIGYVEQDAPVLAGSVRENLLIATPEADDEALMAALRAAHLTELVERSPAGLDAPVGESGVLLSGGQRQRLALARTLLTGAPILLLDEPTSNLDARSEHALRLAIDAVAEQRTLLVVAHRLATVVDADQIVVFDEGRVVAAGGHDELTRDSPLYHELAAHQLLVR
ncbi:ABC transporter ATP-binding protein [Streptomyces sp. ventii]|uniref:ABC transporter ATP-binding protein n=2 Tax=Streptomyces spiramenti TaxID=2720606 RepID=A0ABX1AJM1_9ACTN|nr:ABC transporter ATP-binding protein [Streptomyces spiramenti]NJP65876.1 ABC transporter ATP-binding protein [Streptomyces spiramenti]